MISEVQKAIYEKLKNAGLPVYDYPPSEVELPFITIGEVFYNPWGAKDIKGHELTVRIPIWSDYWGMKEVNELSEAVSSALQSLSIPDFYVVHWEQLDGEETIMNELRGSVLRFKLILEEV